MKQEEKKETRGRKPLNDPKQSIPMGIRTSVIEKIGGREKVQNLTIKLLDAYVKKN